jgi:purine nucleoside permease
MRRQILVTWVLLAAAMMLTACVAVPVPVAPPMGQSAASLPKVSVILTAFGDKDATFGETQPYLKALTERVDRTPDSAYCKGLYEGKILDQPVLVATTGTGADNSGPCMQEILQMYGRRVREVIWSGIAGATPAVGGIVDAKTGKLKTEVEPVMIGDVCISPLAWNYDLHFSSVADWKRAAESDPVATDGWWRMRESSGKTDVLGFENVEQYAIADKALADELLAAAGAVEWPSLAADTQKVVQNFFPGGSIRPVRVFDYTQCAEVASNTFWHGVVEDRLSRQYLADLINASGYTAQTVTEDDVVVLSAMEAVAWMSVVERWTAKTGVSIPMVVIRAASNYDHVPLDADGQPRAGADGKPLTAMEDILHNFQESGASFAWQNAALPVFKMFEMRQQE